MRNFSFAFATMSEHNNAAGFVPLDSPIRVDPIHSLLPEIKVPAGDLPTHSYNPITCTVMSDELTANGTRHWAHECTTESAVEKAVAETAKEARQRIDEVNAERERILKEMKAKAEERDTERRVFEKFKQSRAKK